MLNWKFYGAKFIVISILYVLKRRLVRKDVQKASVHKTVRKGQTVRHLSNLPMNHPTQRSSSYQKSGYVKDWMGVISGYFWIHYFYYVIIYEKT